MPSIAGNNFLVFAVLVLVALLLLFEALYLLWRAHKGPQARKLQRRLQTLAAVRDRSAQTQLLRERMASDLPLLKRLLQRIPRLQALDRLTVQSGLAWSVSKLLLGSGLVFLGTFAAATSIARLTGFMALLAALLAAALPILYVRWCRDRRITKIESQLPEVLDLLTRALRAGHAFTGGLKMAGDEMADPIAAEFRTVHDEINFGVSLQQALTNLCERVPSTDLRYFVVAVLIQRDSGGNLTEILSKLSALMRERAKLMGKIRVLSADGRMSAWVLGLMPFFLAGAMNLANPEFMSRLWTDSIGIAILKTLLVMMVLGALVLRQISRIRV